MKRTLALWVAVASAAGLCVAVAREPAHTPAPDAPPARLVSATAPERLASVELTEDAQTAFGLELAVVETLAASETRIVPGEVMVPIGRDIVLAAPVGGRIVAPRAARRGQPARARAGGWPGCGAAGRRLRRRPKGARRRVPRVRAAAGRGTDRGARPVQLGSRAMGDDAARAVAGGHVLLDARAIPLSLGAAILVLYAAGATINTMILAGLVIALGEVVDDAIIDVENILRRLRENARAEAPRSAFRVALDASLEVRSAVVYATAIVILVFLPVWFLEGVSGAFFRPLALAYGLGVLASLAVALTVTPALALMLLPHALPRDRPSPILVWVERRYEQLLPKALARPRLWVGIGLTSIAACLVGLYRLEGALLPEFRESDFLMHWVAQPGTSLEALRRTTARVSPELRAIAGVDSFGAHLGRAEAADEVVGTNFGELWVHVRDDVNAEHTAQQIRQTIARYPGLRRDLETYLRERIDEVISGTSGSIVVRVSGPELEVLRHVGSELAGRLRDIEGVDGVRVEQLASIPELLVEPKPEATALGFLTGDVRRAVSVLVQGERVGELIRAGRPVPVVVRGPAMAREDASALADTVVQSASGARARLRDVASLTLSPTPSNG